MTRVRPTTFRGDPRFPSCRWRYCGTRVLGVLCLLLHWSVPAFALQSLAEDEMAAVSGAGLAFALDDFRFQAAPTSYIEQTGGLPSADTSFNRGDLRWFGVTMSGWYADEAASERGTWAGTCGNGLNNMGCPLSSRGITNYANHDNPFVLRVFEYTRVGLDPAASAAGGNWLGSPVLNGISSGGVPRTVLELLGPSDSDNWRWAFWGEIQVSETDAQGEIANVLGILRNQNLIIGKPAAHVRSPSLFGVNPATNPMDGAVLRLVQYRGDRVQGAGSVPVLDETLGIIYQSRLSGDYRFSVNQQTGMTNAMPVPRFTNQEGLYFTDVNAFLPLGQMHYQAIVLDSAPALDGNFVIELTGIPNHPNVYNDFYSVAGQNGYQRNGRNDRYYQTHGYVNWGSAFPTCAGANCLNGSGVNQLRFSTPDANGPDGPAINITSAVRSCEANNGCQWTGQVGNVFSPTATAMFNTGTSRAQIAETGGISFVSRAPGATWQVLHDQSRPRRDYILVNPSGNNNGYSGNHMIQRTTYGCGFLNLATCYRYQPRNYAADYNPMLNVNAINLGTARVEGLMVHFLKVTSLGAASL